MITILGVVPSLKNNKQLFINRRTGKHFITSSQKTKDWNTDALLQLRGIAPITQYPVVMYATFYVKDNRRRDIDNMLSSCLDIIVKAGILEDDSWQFIPRIVATAELDKTNPRVEILFADINE